LLFVPSLPQLISIDIKPGRFPNNINPASKGAIRVAILTTDTFDAATVDPLSVRFARNDARASHGRRSHIEDVDEDGDLELVLRLRTRHSGILCGDTSASISGETLDGQAIHGTDAIITVGC
jgi:hypothetical protein